MGIPQEEDRVDALHGEVRLTSDRALDALRTVQLLEEAFGPKGYRRLASVLRGRESEILDELSQLSFRQMRALEGITEEWRRVQGEEPPVTEVTTAEKFSREELVQEFVELKREEVQVLREAARAAPTGELAEKIEELAREQEGAAERLAGLL